MSVIKYNENTRVKIPVILHLIRLGYEFVPSKVWKTHIDPQTNIMMDVFVRSFVRLNPCKTPEDAEQYVRNELAVMLNNDDLGRQFYNRLVAQNTGERLVDFDNFDSNEFHVATEVICKNEGDEFTPDVTVFVNGLPLAFYEVKKPNNSGLVEAEFNRMAKRNAKACFRRFMNITQLMLFSNNDDYSEKFEWQGSFYCTTSKGKPAFSRFREQEALGYRPAMRELSEDVITAVIKDTKAYGYDQTPEFKVAIDPQRPAARHATSLLSRERLWVMLRFGIAFVENRKDGGMRLEKHIMRYPQVFASIKLRTMLDKGLVKGTIWHTQGSGKTALAYHTVKNLTEYYSRQGIVPKFFFVVDRIDLAKQAHDEFEARGLKVLRAESRSEFDALLTSEAGKDGNLGKDEINVVNIQKFETDGGSVPPTHGNRIKRVFLIDEAHRSYKPTGTFLGALLRMEKSSIYIGLTGTPRLAPRGDAETREDFLKREKSTKDIFGDYIDTYYYNQSIQDGYTLRLLHEMVETKYRSMLEDRLREIEVIKGDFNRNREGVYAHENFVTPMTAYIVNNLREAQALDPSIGGMVVCDSSPQARKMKEMLDSKHPDVKAALILCDEGTDKSREDLVDKFKNGEIDLLVVVDMLLTGFNAPRLKKLYMGRVVRDHKLLQTLARVNRPYKDWKYGHVVDFADIRNAFDAANAAYMEELKYQMGDEWHTVSDLFHKPKEIEACLKKIRTYVQDYSPDNLAYFETLLKTAEKKELLGLYHALHEARELRASIIGGGYDISTDEIDRFIRMELMVKDTLAKIYKEEAKANGNESEVALERALDAMLFIFEAKGNPVEMKLADEFADRVIKARQNLNGCFDRKSAEWINLYDELMRLLDDKGFTEMDSDSLKKKLKEVEELEARLKKLQHEEQTVLVKYELDARYARLHRYLLKKYPELSKYQQSLVAALNNVRRDIDELLDDDANIVVNRAYFQEKISHLFWKIIDTQSAYMSEDVMLDAERTLIKEYSDLIAA